MLTALQSDSVNLSAAAPGALRTFFRIVADWQLSAQDTRVLLGNPPESTFYKWKSGQVGQIGRDVLERISYVLGIYKALQILLPNPTSADGWIKRPNCPAKLADEACEASSLSARRTNSAARAGSALATSVACCRHSIACAGGATCG